MVRFESQGEGEFLPLFWYPPLAAFLCLVMATGHRSQQTKKETGDTGVPAESLLSVKPEVYYAVCAHLTAPAPPLALLPPLHLQKAFAAAASLHP